MCGRGVLHPAGPRDGSTGGRGRAAAMHHDFSPFKIHQHPQGPPGGFLSQSCSAIARRLMWHQHPTEGGWPSVVSPEVGGQLSEKLD